jgi:hypothetical protein
LLTEPAQFEAIARVTDPPARSLSGKFGGKNMNGKRIATAALLMGAAIGFAGTAAAQTPKRIGTYKDSRAAARRPPTAIRGALVDEV